MRDLIIAESKTCTKCRQTKPVNEYYPKYGGEGVQAQCKQCTLQQQKRWQSQNVDRVRASARESSKRYYATHREECNQRSRGYHDTHRDQVRERQAQWYQDNAVQERKRSALYKQANPEKVRAHNVIAHAVRADHIPPATHWLCWDCGVPAHEYHHPDYTQPTYVTALCCSCHRLRHLKVN